MATSTTTHRPIKGILKNKSSSTSMEDSAQPSGRPSTQELHRKKSQKWDESNIRATHYPSYKDYDLMKMNEPGSSCVTIPHDGEDTMSEVQVKEAMTPDILAKKLATLDILGTNHHEEEQESSGAHTSKYFLDQQERQRQFELKRKLHYNEGLNIKLARQLISEELQGELEEDEANRVYIKINEEKTEEATTSEHLETITQRI